MKVITTPEIFEKSKRSEVCCFLAGGITNCRNWQNDVITELKYETDNLILFNPRRENFPIHDSNAALEQISWEFKWLENCDIFSIYFDGTNKSDQPICFYELGRNIERMKIKFPVDWEKRIIISVDKNFKRADDVIIQTKLATSNKIKINVSNSSDELIQMHINRIKNAFKYLLL